MTKILYFTDDFTDENIAKAHAEGLTMRKASAVTAIDFAEECDVVCGDVPDIYKDKPLYQAEAPKPKRPTAKAE